MPRPHLPHLHKQITRHGKIIWYVRKGHGPRTRLRAKYGTEEFTAEYEGALKGAPPAPKTGPRSGSLSWLWDRYRETQGWAALALATRRQRENIMVHVLAKSGTEAADDIDASDIDAAVDDRRNTPAQARNFLDAVRGLFRWSKKAGHTRANPTEGVENPKRKKGNGFPPWNEGDVARYYGRWPVGTRERVWLDMLLYTGPRRGDVCKLGRQHVRASSGGREIAFRTEKGGEMIEVTIPLLPVLEATLAAGPCGDLAFIIGDRGHPFTKESFGNAFSAAARKAGVFKSAHGVRKIAATTAADNGATIHQLMAIFGWTTVDMPELYTREANRRRLGRESAHTLGNASRGLGGGSNPITDSRTDIPSPIKLSGRGK